MSLLFLLVFFPPTYYGLQSLYFWDFDALNFARQGLNEIVFLYILVLTTPVIAGLLFWIVLYRVEKADQLDKFKKVLGTLSLVTVVLLVIFVFVEYPQNMGSRNEVLHYWILHGASVFICSWIYLVAKKSMKSIVMFAKLRTTSIH